MYTQALFVQSKENTGEIFRGLLETARSAEFPRMSVAVAYASTAGCLALSDAFRAEVPGWIGMRKEWLVSFDFGLTDPEALELLANLANSEVRIANAENCLAALLRPTTRFHNKLYLFQSLNDDGATAVFSGSANLTVAGLYLNGEQATSSVWIPPINAADRPHFENVMRQKETVNRIIASGSLLDQPLLERYRALWKPQPISEDRNRLVEKITEHNPEVPLSEAVALATATAFWIDVRFVLENFGPGVPGNQIDLPRGSRAFFGLGVGKVPVNTHLGTVQIRLGGQVTSHRMRFGNNQMDKLNLPKPGEPGHPVTYRDQTVLFVRNEAGTFTLQVGTPADIEVWKGRSRAQNTLYHMQGGREFGVFN